ncbi:hypothetical protein P7K49_031868 [Saguinus oedipus]|uniref:Uncharacterized protein n=1 Tax=Saguinus oedipus TaxID=9490 RepID=A0ABQ9U0R3_SAGOE|nr:hypothetical protein P7K49_031868 [Saguinus oedipus]
MGEHVRAGTACCGFQTQWVAGLGPVGREPDLDFHWEPEEPELQEVERAQRQVFSSPGTSGSFTNDVFHRQFREFGMLKGSYCFRGHEASSKDPKHSTTLKAIDSKTHGENTPRRWREGMKESRAWKRAFAALGHQAELQKYSSDCESTKRTGHGGLPTDQELAELKAREWVTSAAK